MYQHRVATRLADGYFGDASDRVQRPMIVANPVDDVTFRSLIDTMVASGAGRPEMLQALLRKRYPNALVRPRALAGERTDVWYVYRDGHWIRSEV